MNKLTKRRCAIGPLMCNFIANFVRIHGICKDFTGIRVKKTPCSLRYK